MRDGRLSIAYVHYGAQSGVTAAVARALARPRTRRAARPGDGRARAARPGHAPAARHARRRAPPRRRRGALRPGVALEHRWNTGSRSTGTPGAAGEALRALRPAPGPRPPERRALLAGAPAALPVRAPARPHPRPRAGEPRLAGRGARAAARLRPGLVRPRDGALPRRGDARLPLSENVARSLVRDYGVDPGPRRAWSAAGANVFPERGAAPRRRPARSSSSARTSRARAAPSSSTRSRACARRFPKARLLVAGPPAPGAAHPAGGLLPRAGRASTSSPPCSRRLRLRAAHAARAVRDRLPRRDGLRRCPASARARGGAGDRARGRDRPPRPAGRSRSRSRSPSSGSSPIPRAPAPWVRAAAPGYSRVRCGATSPHGSSGPSPAGPRGRGAGAPDRRGRRASSRLAPGRRGRSAGAARPG